MTVIALPKRKKSSIDKIDFLEEILPNVKKYEGETIVIHIDNSVLYEENLLKNFASDVALLKRFGANPIVIHGGNKFVEKKFNELGFEFKMDDGIIVTDDKTIDLLEMTLTGYVSSKIVSAINDAGGSAVGLSGKDACLIEAKKFRKSRSTPNSNIENIIDFGFNGEPTIVNPEILLLFDDSKSIPVVSSIARGENAETFHINSLMTSSIVASSIVASLYIIIDDEEGISEKKQQIYKEISAEEFEKNKKSYIIDKEISSNISCALTNHVSEVMLLNGRVPHVLMQGLFTNENVGTKVTQIDDEEFEF